MTGEARTLAEAIGFALRCWDNGRGDVFLESREVDDAAADMAGPVLAWVAEVFAGEREALARVAAMMEPEEDWPTNAALGGGLTGTRDDEWRDSHLEGADAVTSHLLGVLGCQEADPALSGGAESDSGAVVALGDPDEMIGAQKAARWVDLFGIDPDYCGGLSVDEFIDRNRRR